jgi:ParB family chromosome partitioning protein
VRFLDHEVALGGLDAHSAQDLGVVDERRVLEAEQLDAARQVVRKGLSVRETERLVKRMLAEAGGKTPAKKPASQSADIRRLEMEVSDKLGARVTLQHTQKGAGKLVISYNSLDELDGILKHIR